MPDKTLYSSYEAENVKAENVKAENVKAENVKAENVKAENIETGIVGAENTEDMSNCCCQKKVRNEKEIKDLMNRLNRIEGQIRGIKRMLEEDAYCIDIINQVSAANCALNSFTKVILANHIKSCVAEDVKEGSEEKLDELVKTLQKLMK
jgi:DNA-binding FrmR family transcriptional regulator